MKRKIRNIIIFIFWAGLVSSIVFMAARARQKNINKTCAALVLNIDNDNDIYFINETEIKNLLRDSIGIIENNLLNEIDLRKIKQLIANNPFVENVIVYTSLNGEIKIDIKQRQPIVRVYNFHNEGFYIDKQGALLPLNEHFTVRALIASGYISDTFSPLINLNTCVASDNKATLFKVFKLSEFIVKNAFWNAMISQIFINKNGDIELIPVMGTHKIIFGDINNMHQKFENLLVFYKKVMSKKGWDVYKEINLKYNNQIVCS